MADPIPRQLFYDQGGRVCILETEDWTAGMGDRMISAAKECQFRTAGEVEFSEKDFKGVKFAGCSHPDRNQRFSLFCPVVIQRIDEEPN